MGANSVAFDPNSATADFDPSSAQAEQSAPQTSQALGFYQGLMKPFDNAAHALRSGVDAVMPGAADTVEGWGKAIGLPTEQEAEQGHQQYIAGQENKGYVPGGVGRVAGEIAGTAPLLLATRNPYLIGAGSSALTSDAKTPLGVAKDAGIGAALGKAGDLVTGGVGRAISANLSPYVQQLLKEGVDLTPGQLFGGGLKSAEDKLTSVPFVSEAIKGAQNRATDTFNKAALNRALAPLGQKLPSSMSAGQDAVDHVYQTIDKSYKSMLPNMVGVADQTLANDFNAIGKNAIGEGVKQDVLNRFNSVLQAQVKDRVINGTFTGGALKDAQSNLGNLGRKMVTSQDADTREVGRLVMDAQQAFNAMLERHNPGFAQELQKTNAAFANYARIRKAASAIGAKDGVFTAPQLSRAVQASDKSAGKGAYARGQALMQDLSDAGKAVLPSTVNDSGTAGRLLGTNPYVLGKGLLASIPFSAVYSPAGTRGIASAASMAAKSPITQGIGRGISNLRLPATLGLPALASYEMDQ